MIFFKSKRQKLESLIAEKAHEYLRDFMEQMEENKFFKMATNIGYCYVVDYENYKVVWMNDRMKEKFGDCIGKKCYDAFQGFQEPCTFCNNKKLKVGDTDSWIFFNQKIQELVLVSDTVLPYENGKKSLYRYEISIPLQPHILQILKLCQKYQILPEN